jgi:division/cell wall cluster transcriptional repressor MraZ
MMDAARSGSAEARNRVRVWAAGATDVEVDRQGRFALPASARSFADLSAEVLVIGSLDRIELWNPERFAERVSPSESYFSGQQEIRVPATEINTLTMRSHPTGMSAGSTSTHRTVFSSSHHLG